MEGGGGGGEPPLQVGEVVIFGDNKTGYVTRAYPMEDKYAVKALGSHAEVKGPNNSFFYFKNEELKRAVPLAQPEPAAVEPAAKRLRVPESALEPVAEAAQPPAKQLPPGRFEGKVKWFSKEKGFGKIEPLPVAGAAPTEDVFLHRNQIEGGPEGAHAQAISEGVLVSYEVTTHYDGKPCACSVQVDGVNRTSEADTKEAQSEKAELIRKLLTTNLHSGVFQVRGVGKSNMEDRFVARSGVPVESLGASCQKAVVALYGVFDGHSGASCADFVSNNLERALFDCLRHESRRDVTSDRAMRAALLGAFRQTEHNYFQYSNKLEGGAAHAWATAGSTACTSVLFGPDEEGRLMLAVANAGDSRVVLGTKNGGVVRMSEDHTPDVPGERRRIETEGSAVVNCAGIWRIVLPSKKGLGIAGLSVSRGFGDLEYKQPAGPVSAVPDVTLRVIDLREDSFVVFASDGVWGPVSDADACRIVSAGLRDGGEDPTRHAAQQLVEEAHRRDGHDDKTAVVVWFGDLPTAAAAMPAHSQGSAHVLGVNKMAPRQVLLQPQVGAGDDMFAVRQPSSAPSKAEPQPELSELDDLFATYARDMDTSR